MKHIPIRVYTWKLIYMYTPPPPPPIYKPSLALLIGPYTSIQNYYSKTTIINWGLVTVYVNCSSWQNLFVVTCSCQSIWSVPMAYTDDSPIGMARSDLNTLCFQTCAVIGWELLKTLQWLQMAPVEVVALASMPSCWVSKAVRNYGVYMGIRWQITFVEILILHNL